MIASLRGVLRKRLPTRLLVEVGGVGYDVHAPLSTTQAVGETGAEVFLHTVLQVREDALMLYGFHTAEARDLFLKLIGVSGIGPRIALNALSGPRPGDLVAAIRGRDLAVLTRLPGIGRKTAERLVLELKDGMETWGGETGAASGSRSEIDAAAALVSLGYAPAAAAKAARHAVETVGEGADVEALLRAALAALTGPPR